MSTIIQQLTDIDALLDAINLLYLNAIHCKSNQINQDSIHKFIQLYSPVYHDLQKSKLSLKDFKIVNSKCAIGAFGKVTVVQYNNTIYALKTSKKSKLLHQSNHSSPMEERLILSQQDPWLPSLFASFQDEKNLYLVMEYAPGGDLQGLMERRQYAPFPEQEAKFYIAELVVAIDRVHHLGYIHRDIKPGNILIDKQGHVKLGDLGSCISIQQKENLSMVGTIPYTSPEMSNSEGHDDTKGPAYGQEVDWWSVGIILYELLYGEPPFVGSNLQIQLQLQNPKIEFKSDIVVSCQAKDLITKLLSKSLDKRMCSVSEIKAHPFFKDIPWDTLREKSTPPFIPTIVSPDDMTFFSATEEEEDESDDEYSFMEDEDTHDIFREYPFVGYTYTQEQRSTQESRKSSNQEFIAQYRHKMNNDAEQSQLEEKNRSLILEYQKLKQHSEIVAKENEDLKCRLDRLENQQLGQSTELKQKLDVKGSECDALVKQNEDLFNKLRTADKDVQHLGSLLKESNTVVEDLRHQLKTVEDIADDLQRQLNAAQQDQFTIEGLQEQLKTAQDNELIVRDLQHRLESAQQNQDILENLRHQLKIAQNNDKIVEGLRHELTKAENNEQIIKDLQRQLKTAQQDQHVIDDLRRQLKATKDAFDMDLQRQLESAQDSMKDQLSSKQSQLDKLKADHTQLQVSHERLKSEKANNRISTTHERSILSVMWQRDKDSLEQVQQTLERSESQLASTKKQVLRLKREIKCLQKKFTPPLTIPETSQRDRDIMEQIEEEKSYIMSTEKTLAARSRLARTYNDFDKEMQISLQRAYSTISKLEDQLKNSRLII